MGGMNSVIEAATKTELKKQVQQWAVAVRGMGLEDIRQGWDSKRVEKTEEGYRIRVYAHS